MVKAITFASAAAAATGALLLVSSSPAQAFLPPAAAPSSLGRASGRGRYSSHKAAVPTMMVSDVQASLLGRFRRATGADGSRKEDSRPVAKGGPAVASPPSSASKTGKAVVEELKDVGQKLSRFTAAVLEEEKSGSGSGSTSSFSSGGGGGGSSFTSGRGVQGSTLKGLPADFMTKPIASDEATVRGASAVVGGVVGFALGGPLLALVGAAWTSYSCTQTASDAGDAARGTGKWAIDFYNFFAKMNRKYTLVQRLSGALGGLYGRFKKEVVPAPNVEAVNKAESALQGTIDVTTRLAKEFNVPELIGTALVKTGELSVSAARGLLEYDRKNKVSEKFAAWLRKELLKEK